MAIVYKVEIELASDHELWILSTFNNMTYEGETGILKGVAEDMAQVYGMLNQARDAGLDILSIYVQRIMQ